MEEKINILKAQILLVKGKTDRLIKSIPKDTWNNTPAVIKTNLNWQLGHIILANYLHGIASISGANDAFKEKVNLPDYIKFYGPNSNPKDVEGQKPSAEELMEAYEFTMAIIFENLEHISPKELDKETVLPNPAVKTKYEALMLLPQHQSWHNGQMAVLKRILKC
jgi:uncharacterized damage-inducible protein DinB